MAAAANHTSPWGNETALSGQMQPWTARLCEPIREQYSFFCIATFHAKEEPWLYFNPICPQGLDQYSRVGESLTSEFGIIALPPTAGCCINY